MTHVVRIIAILSCAAPAVPAGSATATASVFARQAVTAAAAPAHVCYRVATTVRAGGSPEAIAVDPRTGRVYVANFGTQKHKFQGSVVVLSGSTNRVIGTVLVGEGTDSVALNSVTDTIYATNDYSNTVSVINGRTLRVVATRHTGVNPQSVAVDGTKGAAYVTNFVNGTVSVISGRRHRITAVIGSGGGPDPIAVNPGNGLLYVGDNAGHDNDTIAIIDPGVKTITGFIALPGNAARIAVDRTTGRIYATNPDSNVTWVISVQTDQIVASVSTGTGPVGVALIPRTRSAFVAASGSAQQGHGTLSVIDTATDTFVEAVTVGYLPRSVAANWKNRHVYVANKHSVSVLLPCHA